VDLIVTDPPYFLINDSGSGFMGKEWDSINTKNAIQIICRSKDFARFVERFSWSLRVESYTVEGSTVLPSVSMRPEGEATSELSSPAPSVVSSSSVAPPRSRATIPPVQGIVITRRELLDYLSVSSPSPTTASGRSPDDALFVVPSSFIQSLPNGIVPESALRTTIGNGCEGTIILPSSTDEARIRDVTEAMIGSASGSKCTAATISDAESAGRNAESARYKLITLGDGENQRTTTWIISLLYAISVTPRSKSEFTHALITQFHRNWLDEALRVLKPGAFAFICTAPRSDCVQDLSIAVKDA